MAAAGAASERGAALLAAVRKNDVEQIKALLKEPGSVVSVDFQSEREAGATALMTCLQSHGKRDGALDTLQCLLSFRPRLDLRNKQGYTALMYASTFGHTECVRLLLAQNPPAAIDAQDNDGMSAAMHAAFAGHLDVIRVMVEASKTPDPTLRNKAGKTASMQAKTIDIQRALGSINGPSLLAAAGKGDAAAMTKLFERDTWLDYQDADGRTALICAAQECRAEAVRCLVTQQEKPIPQLYMRDKHGFTALIYASMRDYQTIARLILSVPTRRMHERDRAAGPAFADAGAVAACMKSSCRVAFGWQVWRSACASCGLVLCGDCASEKATVGGKARESVCKLCKELLDEAAAK